MSNSNEHLTDVFASVLQHGAKNSEIVFQFITLDAEQLFEGYWLYFYKIIVEYFRLTGTIISGDEFNKFIKDSQLSEEDGVNYIQLFSELSRKNVKSDAFKFYVDRLKNKVMSDKGYVMLVNANKALTRELTLGKKTYSGYAGMRKFLTEKMYDMDRLFAEYSPEGSVADEVDSVIEEYQNLKNTDHHVSTGFSPVDECTGGLSPGELWLLAGYAAEGKTSLCINIGHIAAYVQQKNVLYLTSETIKSVVKRRLISRHALHLFNKGIDLSAWKMGNLSAESVEILQKTLKDIREHKSENGVFHIVQMPGNANTDFVSGALNKFQSRFNADLCILDAIHLLQPKHHRQSEYSELGEMLMEIKKIIISHNGGKGVPLISPWHTNRSSWDSAKQIGHYTMSSLAKTGEAERCADVIVTILRENSGLNELKGSVIKNRDGQELEEFYLKYDFSTCYVGDSQIDNATSFDFSEVLNIS